MNAGDSMSQTSIYTFADAMDHALDYMGAATDPQTERFARKAVQLAILQVQSCRNWTYYYQRGRLNTKAAYLTGTIEYVNSTRLMTLTGGVWPTGAADGVIIINTVPYLVTERISDFIIKISTNSNPGADIAAGTNYLIYQEAYTLPVDFGSMGEIIMLGRPRLLTYVKPDEFVLRQRVYLGPLMPIMFTITDDPHRYGSLAIRLYPAPDQVYPIDFAYRRRARALMVSLYSTGTASVTDGLLALTGIGTNWTNRMVGCIIRFAQDATSEDVPTGITGGSPFFLERVVTAFADGQTLTLDQDPQVTLSGVKYSISDPVDIEAGAMLTYFLREIEAQCRMIRRLKAMEVEEFQHKDAMMTAMEFDNRRHEMQSEYGIQRVPWQNWDLPIGAERV